MNELVRYIVLSTGCLSILYLFYRLFLANKTTLQSLRWYLLFSLLISLLIPFNRYSFFTFNIAKSTSRVNNVVTNTFTGTDASGNTATPATKVPARERSAIPVLSIVGMLYCIITGYFLVRLVRQFYLIWTCYRSSEKEKKGAYTIVWNGQHKKPFSFFRLLFLNRSFVTPEQQEQITAHEKVHMLQYHSFDIILVEIVTAITWFNPVVWLFRNTVQLVHEYLADAGVLDSGINKLQYQALLLNQIAETELVTIYSGFNQSSINKRFIMMQTDHPNRASRYKLLLLVPITSLLIPVTGCLNGRSSSDSTEVVTTIAPTKLNVLYIGIDNPVSISVSEYAADDITVSIDNGSITGKNGEYNVRPHVAGKAVITVAAKGKTIRESEFRVKYLPPPVVVLKPLPGNAGLIKGGDISKEELLKADGIKLTIENSEFELPMKVASFDMVVRAADKSVIKSAGSTQDNFSAEQVALIKSLEKGQHVTIENIAATSPGGNRKTPMIMDFTIRGK
ncbi:hypothetical protein A3860_13540 [Niastella vici]|uniref:Peptidase M56 domain-containing protein n=1 Tax=Niastella vici TaxID=1703345 RepID=A0A1V9G7B2_9BACT|nr:M56 family metallopeptidase [Niastella vici]OQP66503.1 hypothetical protein A3860_13540 [Niastella vici]